MERSGGSGGRSSGGSGGGSRSSGGRSGGIGSSHGSGGGGSWGSFGSSGGSSGSRLFGSGTRMSSGGTPGGGNHDGGSGGPVGCGCGFIIILLIVLILVLIIGAFVASVITGPAEVTKSTINRQPLPAGSVNETEYYRDELGWIKNQTKMEEGLKYFYQKTGVQPYVVIIDNINGSYHPTESELDSYAMLFMISCLRMKPICSLYFMSIMIFTWIVMWPVLRPKQLSIGRRLISCWITLTAIITTAISLTRSSSVTPSEMRLTGS